MIFRHPNADLFIPDHAEPAQAFGRVTHLGIVSHQDDLEIAAYHGIAECFRSDHQWFGGVVVTNGSGSPRKGAYEKYTDEQMQDVRRLEQRKAAFVGEYSVMVQLGYPSDDLKNSRRTDVCADILSILTATRPEFVYLHNPADRHDTHVATFLRCLDALRAMPMEHRPKKVYGCEVWRKLDWLLAEDKEMLKVDNFPHLISALLAVFDSQISGGKRYDLAEEGLRRANATYFDSHTTDSTSLLTFAMDLTPLIQNDDLSAEEFTLGFIDRLKNDVRERIRKFQ